MIGMILRGVSIVVGNVVGFRFRAQFFVALSRRIFQEVDCAIGSFGLTDSRLSVIAYSSAPTYPITFQMAFYTPLPPLLPAWLAIFMVFNWEIWAALAVSAVLFDKGQHINQHFHCSS